MGLDKSISGKAERFSEVLEAKIETGEGEFAEPLPFLRTAVRGLAKRLNDEVIPMGFVNATEHYLYDLQTEVDGFSGEPMPIEVRGMPSIMVPIVRMTAQSIALEAFGEKFGEAVDQQYKEIAAMMAAPTDPTQS